MNDRLAFLRAICVHPDDDTPRLVFADWLTEHDDPLGDFIRDRAAPSPEDDLIGREMATRIEDALAPLSEREQEVLRLRFGLSADREYTLAEVGRRLGLSRERVRQLETRALAKLRRSQAA